MEKKKILIIEDDPKIRRYLELELIHEGYNVVLCEDGFIGLETFFKDSYSLVLLDLMMPKISGEEVCKKIREVSNIPILILTAKDETFSKINLLDIGADDYITKPFVIGELLARMRVIFRNKKSYTTKNIIQCGDIILNLTEKEVQIKDEKISLTKTEFKLLEYLMENKNIVVTRDKILENVWGYNYDGQEKIVDIYIKALRKKIDLNDKYIKTVRGFGYMLKREDE